MSRLIDPGVGDVTDRLTILALKVLHGRKGHKDVAHFEKEQASLYTKIRTKDPSGPWLQYTFELAAVNAALWHAEDELRTIRSHDPNMGLMEDAGRLGCRIQELNDQRANLITMINKEAGDSTAPEKL